MPVPPWAHIHFLEALPFSALQSPGKPEKPVWFCFTLIFLLFFFLLFARVPALLCRCYVLRWLSTAQFSFQALT